MIDHRNEIGWNIFRNSGLLRPRLTPTRVVIYEAVPHIEHDDCAHAYLIERTGCHLKPGFFDFGAGQQEARY